MCESLVVVVAVVAVFYRFHNNNKDECHAQVCIHVPRLQFVCERRSAAAPAAIGRYEYVGTYLTVSTTTCNTVIFRVGIYYLIIRSKRIPMT